MSSVRLVVKIWDASRTTKKSFVFIGNLSTVIEKANAVGIEGSKLVLESDGTEIDDAEVFQYFAEKNEVFQLYPENIKWTSASLKENERETIEQQVVENNVDKNIINWINTSAKTNDIPTLEFVELPNSPLSATISMSSGRISSLNSEKSDNIGIKNAQKLFAGYQIPYNKMPEELVGLLNEQKPLGRFYTDFIHTIVTDMRRSSFYIPQTVFRQIAEQVVSFFPKSLGVLNSAGELVSEESVGLATKLVNHNNYLNRTSSKTGLMKPTKRNTSMSEGVPNFYAKNDLQTVSEGNSEAKRLWLREHFKMDILNEELKQEITTVFKNTFTAQRTFLVNNPKIIEVRQCWPHLLSSDFLILHFEILMNISETMFLERWDNLKIKTIEFSQKNNKKFQFCSSNDDLQILEIISLQFKENLQLMIRQYPAGTSQNEMEALSATPCCAFINSNDKSVFYFFIENQTTNNWDCFSTKRAIFQIIASFFVFNLEYPTQLSQTFEVLQRTCLNLNTDYSRSKKKKLNNKAKVLNFLKEIL